MKQLPLILLAGVLALFIFQTSCQSDASSSSDGSGTEEEETPKIAPPERQELSALPQKFIDQMEGNWKLKTGSDAIRVVERWEKGSDILLKAVVTTYANANEQISKYIEIFEEDGKVYYNEYMNDNQRRRGTWYPLVYVGENSFSFEEETNKFPQIITYTFTSPDALTLMYEGVMNKKVRKQEFNYARNK